MNKLYPILLLCCLSCADDKPKQEVGFDEEKDSRREKMNMTSDMNKMFTEQDLAFIRQYLDNPSRNWDMDTTGSGLFYYIFEKHDGVKPVTGDVALLEYEISLLDGTLCYTSEENGAASFVVDKEDLESGLHEAVKMLGVGDQGIFIMHHSRAHGLMGDSDAIRPLENVVYKLKLIELK